MRAGRWAFGALLLHSALIQGITFLLRPATTYQALALDVPVAAIGAIAATFALVPLALAIPTGTIVDRVGARAVLVAGSLLTVAAAAGLLFAGGTVVGLVVSTGVLGAGHLGCIVGQQSIVANSGSGRRLDAMFGYYTFSASLGQAVGPLVIAVLGGEATTPDTTMLFAVGAGMSVLLAATAGFLGDGRRAKSVKSASGPWWKILRLPGVAKAIATSAVIAATVDLTVVFIPAMGAERGLAAFEVGFLLSIRAMTSMASRLFLGVLALRMGRTRLMVTSIVVAALSLIALAVPLPVPVLYVLAGALGLGLGIGQPLTMSWVAEQVEPARRGTALSIRLAGNRLAQVSIPAALGVFAVGLGAGAVLGATGILVATTLLLVRGVRLDDRD